MFSVLRRSRGYGKFKRNRWAMFSLAVIAVYVAVAGWVLLIEGAQAIGERTGAFDLRERPVAGLLLADNIRERVGPRWVAGMGAEQSLARRVDQADFVFKRASEAIEAAERAEKAGGSEGERAAAVAGALERGAMFERRLADVPLAELQALRDAAEGKFVALDAGRRGRVTVEKARDAAATAAEALKVAVAADATGAKAAAEKAASAVEDVMFALEDVAKAQGSGEKLTGLGTAQADIDRWQDLADAARAGKPEGLRAAAEAVEGALKALRADAERAAAGVGGAEQADKVAAIEAAVERLMPMPTGAAGTLYSVRLALGTDNSGRSILLRGIYSAKTAIQVGFVVALASVLIGAALGAAAAYFGGWVDHAVTWLYSTLSSLPQLVLLAVLAFMFLGTPLESTLVPIYVALCLTFWIGPCRVIRGEVLKVKELEYVQAGRAIGFGRGYILLRHVIPNTSHLMFINFSLLFIGAVKTEVILTFLGLGLKDGASWGRMISDAAPEVVNGMFWQIGAATVFMLVLVTAFNVVSDALQDAFDPKHVG